MELLRTWLNDDLGLSRPVDSFEADFANGYLIGEVLLRHGLLPNADSLADKSTPMAMVTNFNLLQQPLLDLGVDFSSKVANAIMTEKKNVATNLCYQLKLGLENCVQSGSAPVHRRGMKDPVLLASTIKPNRAPLQRFEAMQSEHFESLVRQAAKSEKELAEALNREFKALGVGTLEGPGPSGSKGPEPWTQGIQGPRGPGPVQPKAQGPGPTGQGPRTWARAQPVRGLHGFQGLVSKEHKDKIDGEVIRALIVLAQMNTHIWYNETKVRRGDKDGNLHLTHGLNGIRQTASNKIMEVVGGRKDYKVDCIAADFKDWDISW